MKKLLTLLVFAVVMTSTSLAQNKFGHMNYFDLLSLMPEAQAADSAIQKYALELNDLIEKMYTEYDTKAADANAKAKKGLLSPEQQELVIKELEDLEKRISEFQESADAKVSTKRQKLYEPVFKKAEDAIKQVAKDNGYTYIFDTSSQSFLYVNEADDVLPLVKKQLNLKDAPAPKAPTKP